MKRLFLSSLLALCFLTAPALSQSFCLPRSELLKSSATTGTFPKVRIMSQNAKGHPLMVEWWVDAKGDTLQVTTQSNGISCIVLTGIGFEIVEDKPGSDT